MRQPFDLGFQQIPGATSCSQAYCFRAQVVSLKKESHPSLYSPQAFHLGSIHYFTLASHFPAIKLQNWTKMGGFQSAPGFPAQLQPRWPFQPFELPGSV